VLGNLNATWAATTNISLTGYVRNVADHQYITKTTYGSGVYQPVLNDPRTYGAVLNVISERNATRVIRKRLVQWQLQQIRVLILVDEFCEMHSAQIVKWRSVRHGQSDRPRRPRNGSFKTAASSLPPTAW